VSQIFKEAQNLKKLRHKNIVELHHAFIEGKQLIMIMELAAGGEVLGYVMKKERLSEPSTRKILLQVVNSMIYCHTRGVVHRDLKLENVLFRDPVEDDDQELYVKVIDFGIAGVCQPGK
jgi:serine/threonine protein kinase